MDTVPAASFLESLTSGLAGPAVLVAGIGALAMAILEAIKAALPIRAWFHSRAIFQWTHGRHASSDQLLMGVGFRALPKAERPEQVLRELLELAIGGPEYRLALYEQASEKMFGQIQSAANVALDFPDRAPALYAFLTRDPSSAGSSDQQTWSSFAQDVNNGLVGSQSQKDQTAEERQRVLQGTQARTRLENLVRRRLDALQTRIDYRWGRFNQIAAFLIAAGIALWTLHNASPQPDLIGRNVVLAVLAGFLAPPAKDLVTALSAIRYR